MQLPDALGLSYSRRGRQVTHIFEVTAAILHMGNIEFDSDGNVGSNVSKATMKHVDDASKLLGVDPAALAKVHPLPPSALVGFPFGLRLVTAASCDDGRQSF